MLGSKDDDVLFTFETNDNTIPHYFILKNIIYIKENNIKPTIIDYKNTINNSKENDTYVNEKNNQRIENEIKNNNRTRTKHTHDNTNENPNVKRFKVQNSNSTNNIDDNPLDFDSEMVKNIYDHLPDNIYLSNNINNISDDEFDEYNEFGNEDNDKSFYNFPISNHIESIDSNNKIKMKCSIDNIINQYNDNNDKFSSSSPNTYNMDKNYENLNNIHQYINSFDNTPKNDEDVFHNYLAYDTEESKESKVSPHDIMNSLKYCYSIAVSITNKIKIFKQFLNQKHLIFGFRICWCFYEIGLIFLIRYVNEAKEEDFRYILFYEQLLEEATSIYPSVTPFLSKYREIKQEAKYSVDNNIKKLIIKDIF